MSVLGESGQAGTDLEAEITPEMLAAGAVALGDVLWKADWQAVPLGRILSEHAAEAVFRAMAAKARR